MNTKLKFTDILSLRFQIFINRALMIIYGHGINLQIAVNHGHHYGNLAEVRKKYRSYMKNKKPTLVCANHLTMVDSFLINHALSPVLGYIWNFKTFPWNVPAIENYRNSWTYQIVTYLGGCIPIDRQGSQEHLDSVLNKIRYLLLHHYVVTMFPEGTRSRTGIIEPDNVTYGVGNILKDFDDYQVVTIYIRGESQVGHSGFPKKGDQIYLDIDCITPKSDKSGMRAARDISKQVILKLKEMEEKYFDKFPERRPEQNQSEIVTQES